MARQLGRVLAGVLALELIGAGMLLLFASPGVLAVLPGPDSWRQPGGIIATAAGLVLLVLTMWPRGGRRVLRTTFEGGTITYPIETVAQMVQHDAARVAGVHEVGVRLARVRGHRLDVHATLAVAAGHDPAAVAAATAAALREHLQRAFGLTAVAIHFTVRPGPTTGADIATATTAAPIRSASPGTGPTLRAQPPSARA
ncbi:MAG: hypothetical protein HYX52_04080 [Chloroflexi bacterium]|nr:hypothetical protein [Chloroflexota bacterium]